MPTMLMFSSSYLQLSSSDQCCSPLISAFPIYRPKLDQSSVSENTRRLCSKASPSCHHATPLCYHHHHHHHNAALWYGIVIIIIPHCGIVIMPDRAIIIITNIMPHCGIIIILMPHSGIIIIILPHCGIVSSSSSCHAVVSYHSSSPS